MSNIDQQWPEWILRQGTACLLIQVQTRVSRKSRTDSVSIGGLPASRLEPNSNAAGPLDARPSRHPRRYSRCAHYPGLLVSKEMAKAGICLSPSTPNS